MVDILGEEVSQIKKHLNVPNNENLGAGLLKQKIIL
jgi:hypothetical protein